MIRLPPTLLLLLAVSIPVPVWGQMQRDVPRELEGVGIEERLHNALPLDLLFLDEQGQRVALGEVFNRERPVILSMTYTDCPMLCHLQLDGLVETLKDVSLQPGEDFEIVNISIDPAESPVDARQTKQKHLQAYGDHATADGWHFLTGQEKNIQAVAEALGFQYQWVEERQEYAHAAAIFVCTPQGTVSRYLYGVRFPASTLRLSVIEASEGKVGSSLDQLLLFCFHYDATTGKYSPVAFRVMQLGGIVTLLALATGLVPFWVRRGRARRKSGSASVSRSSATPQSTGGTQ